jgi:predicted type IV restriction endonuclease
MDLAARIAELQKRTQLHKEVLLTEEAAKTELVMPFIQALGYDVFNPSEVIPEFCADVGTKKGEKVDYVIKRDEAISILIECKPVSSELNINHAAQLFRYFSVTNARLAILTNGINYQFYSDIDQPNIMDQKPFFNLDIQNIKPNDIKTIEKFSKNSFDIDKIVHEAANLKIQSLIRIELEREFSEPSLEFVRVLASRIHQGRMTTPVLENFAKLISASIAGYIRDMVTDRLASALKASGPAEADSEAEEIIEDDVGIVTTEEEIAGFQIVRAIAARLIDPKRVVIRDQKSYCAILIDDNNRKSLARMHFNSEKTKYFGTFSGKDETKHPLSDVTDIYRFEQQIAARILELNGEG